jgi:hypothetical protein
LEGVKEKEKSCGTCVKWLVFCLHLLDDTQVSLMYYRWLGLCGGSRGVFGCHNRCF